MLFWIGIWVGLPIVAALIGNAWPSLSPFRTTFAGIEWLAQRLGARRVDLEIAYPPGLARWPAVALLAEESGAVVSASHNPPEYNGIKFFGADGMKLPDAVEAHRDRLDVEDRDPVTGLVERVIGEPAGVRVGRAYRHGASLPHEARSVRTVSHVDEPVRLRSAAGRWLLLATVLGSSMAMLDGTVVNVALPTIGDDLDADVGGLQWVVNGYTLSLASLILLGGALGDRFGRRRVFVIGVLWFAVASLLCGIAPDVSTLVAARVLQGVGGALLTPGSLALISASFDPDDRGAAIGAWSGLGGVAAAVGPLLGGWLVEAVSWRAVFLLNLPLAVLVVWVCARHVPESRDPHAPKHLDVLGVALTAGGLAVLTYGLIASSAWLAVGGLVVLLLFVVQERRSPDPLVPLGLFRDRVFSGANLVTFVVYGALGAVFFLLVVQLQVVAGYSPLAAGAATLPVTFLMLLFSSYAGAVATRIGPRTPMTVGPVVAAAGLLLMLRIGPDAAYLSDVAPGVVGGGRPEEADYLRELGAAEVIDRRTLSEPGAPIARERWAGAVDSVGSHTLANVLAQTQYRGVVTACGLAQGLDLPGSVLPFILRNVTLAGIDSVNAPQAVRLEAWSRLARDLDLGKLARTTQVVALDQVPAVVNRMFEGKVQGRVVVDVNA